MSRLFFALWPDDEVRSRLTAATALLPARLGRPVPPENLHITLLFLGSVDEPSRNEFQGGAARLRGTPFVLELDRSGWWPGPAVAWIAPSETPAELVNLVDDLRSLASRLGMQTETRPYRPHLTVARKVRRRPRPLKFEPIRWQITSFSLVQSVPGERGSEYRELERWPLT